MKTVAIYLNEIVLFLVLGGILLMALTGGFGIAFAGISLSAYYYQKPFALLGLAFLLRKILRGEFLAGFLLPPFVQQGLLLVQAFFQQFARRFTTASRFRRRVVSAGIIVISLLLLAALTTYLQQGLTGRYYTNTTEWSGTPYLTFHDRAFDLRRPNYDFIGIKKEYGIQWDGVIYLPVSGTYHFMTRSDDGSEIWIDEQLIVDNGGFHGAEEKMGQTRLARGFHSIRIRYMQGTGGALFEAKWKAPKQKVTLLSTAIVFPQQPGALAWIGFQAGSILLTSAKIVFFMGIAALGLLACHNLMISLRAKTGEYHLYFLLLGGLALAYGIGSFLQGAVEDKFGFAALPLPALLLGVVFLLAAMLTYQKRQNSVYVAAKTVSDALYARKHVQILLAIACVLLFFVLRNEFVNSDGIMYKWQIPVSLEEHGTHHIRVDEVWEFYVHSLLWKVMKSFSATWTVRLSYQVLSCLGGGVFIGLLLVYSRRLFPQFPLPFFLLMLVSGYMQMFFGDVENYTLTGVMILAYYVASLLYLEGRQPLMLPSAVLALAITFHLLAGFLLPSLMYLYLLELKKKRFSQIALGFVVSLAVVAFTILYHQLSFDQMYRDSWAGQATWNKNMWEFLAWDRYHWQQYNLLALMFPAHLLLLPLLVYKRIKLDRINVHLLLAVGGMMIFLFNYKGLLGAYNDWNLYANAAVPLAIFVWRNALMIPDLRYKTEILFGFGGLSALHSLSWIISNHSYAVIDQLIG